MKAAAGIVVLVIALTPSGGHGGDRPAPVPAPDRRIVFTVDDLPGRLRTPTLAALRDANQRLVATFKRSGVPAIGFVNEKPLHVAGERDARVAILRGWLDAGLMLGNHTFRHRSLSRTPLREYQDDVLRGEVITRQLMDERGFPLVWFRHPYTHSGPTLEIKDAFERFLAERGYRVAPFTFDHSDWIFSTVYEEARAVGDAALAARVRREHLLLFERQCEHHERLAQALFGREVPQILLTHVNRINAELMPDMLALLRRRGYRFITLDEALRDPAYATPDRYAGKDGMSWLNRWALALGRKVDVGPSPRPPADLVARYQVIDAQRGGNGDL